MWLLIALIVTPLVEIALFIQVGGLIGLWPTILLVLVTAALGAAMLRRQGLATMARIRTELERGGDPSPQLAHGALLLFSGALLLTPGFFTDAVGFALLSARMRQRIIAFLGPRIARRVVRAGPQGRGPGAFGPRPRPPDTDDAPIEAEYQVIEPGKPREPGEGR